MIVMNANSVNKSKIETFPTRGSLTRSRTSGSNSCHRQVLKSLRIMVFVFLLSEPEEIPIHNHFYVQTMYILSGRIAIASHHSKADERLEEKILGRNDFVFVPSMEPHSMRNLSDNEDVTFLCCIANIYENEGI